MLLFSLISCLSLISAHNHLLLSPKTSLLVVDNNIRVVVTH